MPGHIETTEKCIHCGHVQAVDACLRINTAEDPQLKERVRDGSLFLWECAACGKTNLIRRGCLYHDPERKLMLWLPGEDAVDDRLLLATAQELPDYTLRRVADVGSLMEKVLVFDAGLEDTVMEMCKWVSRIELAETMPDKREALLAAPFKFFRMEGADNELVLSFPMDGQMYSSRVGFNVYEDCRGILQRNPAALGTLTGFARVDSDWIASLMR